MKRQQYFKQKHRKKFSRKIGFITIAFISAIAVAFLSLRIYAQVAGAPPLTVPKASIFLDSNKNQIGDYFTDERRYWADLEDISPYLIDATVAVEDKDFFEHGGLDYSRIAGALLADIKAGSKVQGASTLTQQYARNLYLSHEKTWLRKVNEALYAYRLELFYSKDEILEGYLNTVYYGHGMYGVEAASRYYYAKSAKDLTLAEASMLAGIPKGPTYYSPVNNMEKATNRQRVILRLMNEQGKITVDEKTRAESEQVVLKSEDWITPKSIAPYFLEVVRSEASKILASKNRSFSEGGWTIQTTLNQAHQRAAEESIKNNMPDNELQVGFVSMDADKGFVTALVGGRDYSVSPFNRVLGDRQPGSAIKPILYAAALEKGFNPMTFMDVSQTTFTYDHGRATYTPQNINKKYADHEMSLAQALAISDNVYAVKTLNEIGYRSFRDMQKRFGLHYSDQDNPAVALGTKENSLYDLTNAYNIIAAGGENRQATTILSIKDVNGNIVYKYEEPKEKEQVISKQDAAVLTQLMTGMFDPTLSDYSPATGVSLRSRMTHAYAAKSGTTNSDQWMIGFTPGLTAGVWNGYDQGKTLSVQADMAASKQVWIDFMETVLDGKSTEAFDIPKGVEAVTIDISSGKLANSACTNNQRLVYLKSEDVPTETCSTFDFFDTDTWGNMLEKLPFEAFHFPW